jgi:hypothetical protein
MGDRSERLSGLLTPDRVVLPLRAADKAGLIAELARALVSGSTADYDQVLGAVLEREGIPHGRAVLVFLVVGPETAATTRGAKG